MHERVLLAGARGGLRAGKYHWMIHPYSGRFVEITLWWNKWPEKLQFFRPDTPLQFLVKKPHKQNSLVKLVVNRVLCYEQCVGNHPTRYFTTHHTIDDAASIVSGWNCLIEPQSRDLEFKTYKLDFRKEGGNVNSGSSQRIKNHCQHNRSRIGCTTIWNKWLLIFIFVTTC